jgi:hypothetical protein
VGGVVDYQPRRVLLDRKRPPMFRKAGTADVIASASRRPVRIQRTRADV